MRAVIASLLLLAACSDSKSVMEELPNSSIAGAPREDVPESRMEEAILRPVTIGEDGPRLAACGTTGIVRGKAAALRQAPFQEARTAAALGAGTRVHVCTRSLDQRWLGIVVIPVVPTADVTLPGNAVAPAADCDVSDPVERRQPYRGPCRSGWVWSASVQLVG